MNQQSKSRKSLEYRGNQCLNCGQLLDRSDRFCPYCSQENSSKQLSFIDYFKEFIGSILVYDSRLRYTIREILFKPGLVSKNYISGQRMKYANPFRFFLSVSIIYFLLSGILFPADLPDKTKRNYSFGNAVFTIDSSKIAQSNILLEDSISNEKLKALEDYSETALNRLSFFDEKAKRAERYIQYYQKYPSESPEEALGRLNHPINFQNKWLYKRAIAIDRMADNPNSFTEMFTSNMPFFLFFFAPAMAVFLRLIYSVKYTYMEHLIFLFFFFSFYFLTKIPLIFIQALFKIEIFDLFFIFLAVPIYFFSALRRFYEQSFWKTMLKFIFLGFIFGINYTISIILYILGIVAVY